MTPLEFAQPPREMLRLKATTWFSLHLQGRLSFKLTWLPAVNLPWLGMTGYFGKGMNFQLTSVANFGQLGIRLWEPWFRECPTKALFGLQEPRRAVCDLRVWM